MSACCLEEVRFLQVCTRAYPPEPCSEGRRRWWEDVQEERQSKPGAWALESQRLLSAKTGGAAGGDWGPTALSWGLGAKEGALWEEDDAENSRPHGLCPHPAHHLLGRKAQLREKVQPGPGHGDPAPESRLAVSRGWGDAPSLPFQWGPCGEAAVRPRNPHPAQNLRPHLGKLSLRM